MTDQEARITKVFVALLACGLFALLILHDKVERDCYRDHPEILPNGGGVTPCTSRAGEANEQD